MNKAILTSGVLLTLAVAACGKPGDEASRTAPATSPAPTTAAIPGQTGEPSRDPAQIAGVMASIAETEVAISKVLLDRNIDGPLADFAKELQTSNTQIIERARELGAATDGKQIAVQQGKRKTEVQSLSEESDDPALMNAYVAAVVRDHGDALTQLDAELIPAAEGELKTWLQQVRMQMAENLEKAQALASARY